MICGKNGFGRLAVGVRVEIQDDAMAQHVGRDLANIVAAEVQAGRASDASTRPHSTRACAPRGELP